MATGKTYRIRVSRQGRIVIPSEIRHAFGWRDGDELFLRVCEDGSLRIEPMAERSMLEYALGQLPEDLSAVVRRNLKG